MQKLDLGGSHFLRQKLGRVYSVKMFTLMGFGKCIQTCHHHKSNQCSKLFISSAKSVLILLIHIFLRLQPFPSNKSDFCLSAFPFLIMHISVLQKKSHINGITQNIILSVSFLSLRRCSLDSPLQFCGSVLHTLISEAYSILFRH